MDLSSEKYIFHPPVFPTLTFTVTQCGPSAVCARPDEMEAGEDMDGQCIIVWLEGMYSGKSKYCDTLHIR